MTKLTIRQQLLAIRTPVKWQGDKVIEYDSIGNDDVIDEIMHIIDKAQQQLHDLILTEVIGPDVPLDGGYQAPCYNQEKARARQALKRIMWEK